MLSDSDLCACTICISQYGSGRYWQLRIRVRDIVLLDFCIRYDAEYRTKGRLSEALLEEQACSTIDSLPDGEYSSTLLKSCKVTVR